MKLSTRIGLAASVMVILLVIVRPIYLTFTIIPSWDAFWNDSSSVVWYTMLTVGWVILGGIAAIIALGCALTANWDDIMTWIDNLDKPKL